MPSRLILLKRDGLTTLQNIHEFLRPRCRFLSLLIVGHLLLGPILSDHLWMELTTHFLPQELLLLAALNAILLLKSTRAAMLSIILILFMALTGPVVVDAFTTEGPPESALIKDREIRIISINVLTSNPNKDQVREWIRNSLSASAPTVVVAQEVDGAWITALDALKEQLPHKAVLPREDNFGLAVYSSLPLQSPEFEALEPICDGPQFTGEVRLGETSIKIFGVHTLPPGPQTFAARNACLIEIEKRAVESQQAAIVAGDLNSSPWSKWFPKRLNDPFPHLFRRHTWSAFNGLISTSLDHVLSTSHFKAIRHSVGPDLGSDHRPVIVDLRLQK